MNGQQFRIIWIVSPPATNDTIHIEDGSWAGADNGDPEFGKWNGSENTNGYSYDRNSWAVITAAENRVKTADAIAPSTGTDAVINGTGNDTDKAWHYFLVGQTSCYWYWDGTEKWDSHPTRAANQAVAYADQVLSANPGQDSVGPSIYTLQRDPYNPGAYEWLTTPESSDFQVWTFAYDVSGMASVTLKYRIQSGEITSANKLYSGGTWVSLPMAGVEYGTSLTDPLPLYRAKKYAVMVEGLTNIYVDYYVEAVDTKGNVSKSDIYHVYVGDGAGSSGDDSVVFSPSTPVVGQSVTVTYSGSLKSSDSVLLHWGYDDWTGVTDTTMTKQADGSWTATVTVPSAAVSTFDAVFTDGNGTWDNNGGSDWHVQVIAWTGDDTTPPTVSLTAPQDGETVSGTVSIAADASDNVAVSRVEFYAGTVKLGEKTSAPYSFSYDTKGVTNGSLVLKAVAWDAATNSASSMVTVTVDNDTQAPSLSVAIDKGSVALSGTCVATATATDNKSVSYVDFALDGAAAVRDSISPYTYTFDADVLSAGSHTLIVTAADAAGNMTVATQAFTVSNTTPEVTRTVYYKSISASAANVFIRYRIGTGSMSAFPGEKMGDSGTWKVWTRSTAAGDFSVEFLTSSGRRDLNGGSGYAIVSNTAWIKNGVVYYSNPDAGDTDAPQVSFTAPSSSVVSGSVSVTADATDNVGVAAVSFYVNDVKQSDDTVSPFDFTWETSSLTNGSYELKAVAVDAAGNSATAVKTIQVSNAVDNAPVVSSVGVPSGEVSGTATLSADASDDNGVASVSFYVGTNLVGTDTSAPFSVTFDTTTVADATYTVRAVATDTIGQTAENTASLQVKNSSAVQVTVHYKRTDWASVNLHYNNGTAWTAVPGEAMSNYRSNWFVKTVARTGDNLEFVFNYAGTSWDNNSEANYTTALTELWVRDGEILTADPEPVVVDAEVPVVSNLAPVSGSVVSNTVALSADATDNVGVSKVEFYVNGSLVGSDTTSPYSLSWSSKSVSNGEATIQAKAWDASGNSAVTGTITLTVTNSTTGDVHDGVTYSGKLGANVYANGVEFSIWWRSDVVSSVSVAGTFNSFSSNATPMTRISSGDNVNVWWVFVPNAKAGDEYKYAGMKVGESSCTMVADPYSQYNRYSNGYSVVVDHTYAWTDSSWQRPGWSYYAIYELHVKDFTSADTSVTSVNRGRYLGVKEKMAYLQNLGVTAIELMPISEFPDAGYSWGYNTSLYFAPESGYAVNPSVGQEGVDQLKALVDAAHAHGIAVVVDMVFNHTANNDNWLWMIDNEAYFNGSTPWGNRLNTEHSVVQRLGKDCIEMYMNKYHIDGFRFDATGNGYISYTFLHELKNHAVSIDPNVYFVYENLPNNSDLKTWGGQWSDSYHDKGINLICDWDSMTASGFTTQIYYSADEGWASSPVEALNYLESHDEDTLAYLMNLAGLSTESMKWRTRQASVLLATSLGVPMIWMGQEFLRSREGQNTDEMSLDWTLKSTYSDIHDYYAGVFRLRRDNPALRPSDASGFAWQYRPWESGADNNVVAWSMVTGNSADKKFVVVFNFNDSTRTVNVGFPEDGTWTKVITETGIDGTGTITASGNSASIEIMGNSGVIFMK